MLVNNSYSCMFIQRRFLYHKFLSRSISIWPMIQRLIATIHRNSIDVKKSIWVVVARLHWSTSLNVASTQSTIAQHYISFYLLRKAKRLISLPLLVLRKFTMQHNALKNRMFSLLPLLFEIVDQVIFSVFIV